MNPSDALLVIPCYRGGEKLAGFLRELCLALASDRDLTHVQVVDDGSPAIEQAQLAGVVENLRHQYRFLQPLIVSPVNDGKGRAIQTGWDQGPRAPWLAFVDADGAVPAAEVLALLQRVRLSPKPALYIGDRTRFADKSVQRFWHRRLGSRLFNQWVQFWLGLNLADTQCGLKVIPASLYFSGPWREAGFAFDLELLLRARANRLPVFTSPIAWQEQPGSSLGPGAMVGLFLAAYRLRRLRTS